MIVICTKCQAKFRVADDRIGARGAKVRCSRCETIIVVQREAAPAAEPLASDGRPIGASPGPAADVAAAGPPACSSPASPPAVSDPFAPFSRAADPFAAAEPFAPAAAAPAALPVTDLADLADPGPAPAPAPRPRAVPPPLPSMRAAAAPLPEPAAPEDDPFDLATPAHAAPLPPPAAPARVAAADSDDGGLALEDRFTPPPMKVPAPDPFALAGEAAGSRDPFADPFAAAGGEPFDPGAFDYAAEPGGPALGVAGDEPVTPPPPASDAPAIPVPAPAAAPAPQPARAPAAEAPELAAAGAGRIPRGSRLRAAAVNAVALAALLLVALAMLVVWRTDGDLDAASLRPAAVLGVLRGGAAKGPFVAGELRSGLYERERGAPVLFVRGKALSRADAAVAAVKVSVEVVRGDEVLARGEAIAGAVPTPEELYLAADDAALARVAAAARARAPAEVRPGDAVPFLVAIGQAPADLEGATLRLELSPAASAR
jgi:predicted Zn finger-like uncharacterized protein